MNQPTLTSKNLPPQVPANTQPAEQPTPYGDIVAKPLRSPNFINLRAKNPNLTLYWGNRSVGDKESGLRYDQLIAMGFKPAQPSEVLTAEGLACPPSLQRDNRIMYGELICLIIPRADYVGALKYNAENAQRRVRKFGSAPQAEGQTSQSALNDISNSKAAREGKIAAFIPNLAEVDAATSDNSGIKSNLAGK